MIVEEVIEILIHENDVIIGEIANVIENVTEIGIVIDEIGIVVLILAVRIESVKIESGKSKTDIGIEIENAIDLIEDDRMMIEIENGIDNLRKLILVL